MAIDIILSPSRPTNPFEVARRNLICALAAIRVPTIGSFPTPDDFGAVKDHIAEVAALADQWLRAVGAEVRSNTSENLNMSYFDGTFTEAVAGWCLFEVERCIHGLYADAEELV